MMYILVKLFLEEEKKNTAGLDFVYQELICYWSRSCEWQVVPPPHQNFLNIIREEILLKEEEFEQRLKGHMEKKKYVHR